MGGAGVLDRVGGFHSLLLLAGGRLGDMVQGGEAWQTQPGPGAARSVTCFGPGLPPLKAEGV